MEIVQTLDGAVQQAAAFWHAGNHGAARTLCRQALAYAPGHAAALRLAAIISRHDGDLTAAVAQARQAVAAAPGEVEGWRVLGTTLVAAQSWEDAAATLATACEMAPSDAATQFHLGQARAALQDTAGATEALCRAAAAGAGIEDIQMCCGMALAELGALEAAAPCFARAAALSPANAKAHMNLGMCHLMAGDWLAGWEEYEWRHWIKPDQHWRWPRLAVTLDDVAGKRVLVGAEQGFGDIVQFSRLVGELARHCASVVWEVYPKLVPLLSGQYDNVTVVPTGRAAQPADIALPIMSLAKLFGVIPDAIPGRVPFLKADPARVAQWRPMVDMAAPVRLGLIWATSEPEGHRSFTLEAARPLLEATGVRVHLLQMGEGRKALEGGLPPGAVDLAADIKDFADTLAIMELMDVVASPDTVTTHLAGGLGRPTWMPLSTRGEWRWLRDRDDSPWYPTLRLFRQQRAGDWAPVMAAMAAALADMVAAKRG